MKTYTLVDKGHEEKHLVHKIGYHASVHDNQL